MLFGNTTKAIGDRGEKEAAKLLKRQGYKILARNFRSLHGEIDIIASNGEFLVFVEVKARKESTSNFESYGFPSDAVTKEKQRHIIYTANIYIKKHPTSKAIRFDVIEVYLGNEIRMNHITDAFCL